MKSRAIFATLTISIVVLILIAIGSFFWIYQRNPLLLARGGVKDNPQATIFISKQAPAMVSLLINPEKLSKFSKLVTNGRGRKQVKREIDQIRDNFLAKTKLDYEKDLQEWLGDEVTLAVTSLDFDHNPDNGVQPGYLLAVKNKDPQLAKEFLQVYYSEEGVSDTTELVFDSYQGVNLIFQRPLIPSKNIPKIASALVGDFVLFANDIQVLKEAINNAQAVELNLANYEAYQEAINTISRPKIILGYLNLPAASAWIANSDTPENRLIRQTLTLSLSVNPQGLITNTALFGVKGVENKTPSLSSPPPTLNYIPNNSILAAAGVNLKEFWEQIASGLPKKSPIQQLINQGIEPIEKSLNINLAEDIFSGVEKQYAVAVLSHPKEKKLDWVFVIENEEIELMETLDNLAKKQGLRVDNLPLFEQTMTAWTRLITASENDFTTLQTEVKGVHTNLDQYEVLTNSVDVLHDTVNNPDNSLLNGAQFKEAIEALPTENDGYLYIDWRQFEPIVVQKFPVIRVAELAFKPFFDNLRSLTITSVGVTNGVRCADIFWRF
jgi:hypothetical protein